MSTFLLIAVAASAALLFLAITGIVGIAYRQPWAPMLLGLAAMLAVLCALGLAVVGFGVRLF